MGFQETVSRGPLLARSGHPQLIKRRYSGDLGLCENSSAL